MPNTAVRRLATKATVIWVLAQEGLTLASDAIDVFDTVAAEWNEGVAEAVCAKWLV